METKETTNHCCQGCGQVVSSTQFHPKECCDSFKAGYALCEREYGDKYAESYQEAHREIVMAERKAGMQKVVEWMIEPCFDHAIGAIAKRECPVCFKAFLKDNGLENMEDSKP